MIIYNPYGLIFDDVVMVGNGFDLSGHAMLADHGVDYNLKEFYGAGVLYILTW